MVRDGGQFDISCHGEKSPHFPPWGDNLIMETNEEYDTGNMGGQIWFGPDLEIEENEDIINIVII